MQKLTFIINSLSSGGAEKVLSVIANELVKKYEVEIIFLEKNEFYELDKRVKKTYLSNFNGNENGIKKLLYLPILAWRLKKYIKKNNIRLLQSHLYRANYVNVLAKLFGSNHKAQIVNAGVISRYLKEGITGKINLFLIKHLYKKANLIIWKSKGMQIDANELFNFRNRQIIINNPYNLEKIEQLANEKIDDFEFKKDKIYLINVGRMESFKKQEWIIQSLKFLDKKVELILIGDGENRKNLEKLAIEEKILSRIHFLGKKKNPFRYVRKSDIFILSSDNGEGFPNVLIEALICDVPAISSDCLSGPREILAPDTDINKQLQYNDDIEIAKYGILYPIGNVKKLAKAVDLLLNNKQLYEKYKNLAPKRAKDFSLEKIIKEYERVLIEKNSIK